MTDGIIRFRIGIYYLLSTEPPETKPTSLIRDDFIPNTRYIVLRRVGENIELFKDGNYKTTWYPIEYVKDRGLDTESVSWMYGTSKVYLYATCEDGYEPGNQWRGTL